ncbi:restriction endonuclease subunit S [Anaerosacchariphilus polymeriproducens]|uniref:Restriction endonuclease subunit S n=1 Tax=Anaerosacchariphilus polymeriproducens TaxID=1812858 RepID=A0A371ASQ1_9FIRM|nr:restriction endonuclease subunit S [Anaerosacchariphilus polymeriproducens]RDU22606.1 restriction endonuclease subunit S [Anaerosacchariphilus polymeriproducens]
MEKIRLGKFCVDKIDNVSAQGDYDIDYIDISSVDNVTKKITGFNTFSILEAPSRAKQMLEKNDVLVSTVRPNLNAIALCDIDSENTLVGSTGFCVLRGNDKVDSRYLFYFCQSKYFINELMNVATGASYPAVSKNDIKNVLIPNITLEKQTEIVEILDSIRGILNHRKEQLKLLDDLIKSRFVEMFGDTISNNKNWEIKQLQELGLWKSGGTPSRANKYYFNGDINWYSAGELNELYLKESVEKITREAVEESSAKIFNKGSMLVGMYDTAAFKMGILEKDSASNQACANIMPNENINIVWLYFNLLHMKEHFLNNRRGIRQKNLNLGMIKEFEIPVPAIELQNEFVSFVQQVDKLKVNVQKSLDETKILFDSLMQNYFG